MSPILNRLFSLAYHRADHAAHHGGADLDRRRVGLGRVHAPAHVRVERQIARLDQYLAGADRRHRPLDQLEITLLGIAVGARGERDATVDLVRGRAHG